jgi:hypothetical protein
LSHFIVSFSLKLFQKDWYLIIDSIERECLMKADPQQSFMSNHSRGFGKTPAVDASAEGKRFQNDSNEGRLERDAILIFSGTHNRLMLSVFARDGQDQRLNDDPGQVTVRIPLIRFEFKGVTVPFSS